MKYIVQTNQNSAKKITATLRVPGDKSISHRAIMFASIATGTSKITGFLEGQDSLNTLRAFRHMGVEITDPKAGEVMIHGVGMHGLKQPEKAIDVGNSGTSMRLLAGLLAGQTFDVSLIGDGSLSKRPMQRVITPLTAMNANITSENEGKPPLKIKGGAKLKAINYKMPMASAQVKSCCLLAGLYATGNTCVSEPAITRDHTERMLTAFGCDVNITNATACITGGATLSACNIDVPADISSAAFFMVAASIASNIDITLTHVGINPTRTGVIDILKLMGANIRLSNEKIVGGEPVADIHIKRAQLKGIKIPEALVPLAIDEFPVLFVAAACAKGETIVTGASELRVKECDRIAVMAAGLTTLGIALKTTQDGIIIQGGQIKGGTVQSHDDHRIAMAFAIAGLVSTKTIQIEDCDNVSTSFPNFVTLAKQTGLVISVE